MVPYSSRRRLFFFLPSLPLFPSISAFLFLLRRIRPLITGTTCPRLFVYLQTDVSTALSSQKAMGFLYSNEPSGHRAFLQRLTNERCTQCAFKFYQELMLGPPKVFERKILKRKRLVQTETATIRRSEMHE